MSFFRLLFIHIYCHETSHTGSLRVKESPLELRSKSMSHTGITARLGKIFPAHNSFPFTMERKIDMNSINKRAIQLIRKISN